MFIKNEVAKNFLCAKSEVTWHNVAIIIRVILLSHICAFVAFPQSSTHYNQSHRVCIYQRRQYICFTFINFPRPTASQLCGQGW